MLAAEQAFRPASPNQMLNTMPSSSLDRTSNASLTATDVSRIAQQLSREISRDASDSSQGMSTGLASRAGRGPPASQSTHHPRAPSYRWNQNRPGPYLRFQDGPPFNDKGICRYHSRFGNRARNCVDPNNCAFQHPNHDFLPARQ